MGQEISLEGSTEYSLKTPNGIFKGLTIRDPLTGKALCHRFSGIRYALPLTKRWCKFSPIPDDYDYSSKEYKEFSAICPQPEVEGRSSYMNHGEFGDEDCAYLNIWVPASTNLNLSETNLPVLFYIHGGWLQYGDASQRAMYDPRTLQSAFEKNFIIVSPAYRLNSIGFLSTKHLADEGYNFGFWDQRTALEWTARFIKHFGGDANKITVAGLSAGSYSTFFQLAYEIYHPDELQLIKQVALFSNCLIIQPKSLEEVEPQFEEYVEALGLDTSLPGPELISKLRSLDLKLLMEAILKLKMHTFRAVTDHDFVSPTLLKDIYSGEYGAKIALKGIRLLIGEVDNEPVMYSYLNTPKTKDDLPVELENYYPKLAVKPLLEIYGNNITDGESLRIAFGDALGASQIYVSLRGFLHNCLKKTPNFKDHVFRYRMSYLPKYVRDQLDEAGIKGIMHSNDQFVWFFASAECLSTEEQSTIKSFLMPYIDFMCLDSVDWGTSNITEYKYFSSEGKVTTVTDPFWEDLIEISEKLYLLQL